MKGSSCCLLKSAATLAMSHASHGLLPAVTECSRVTKANPFLGDVPNMGTHGRWLGS